MYPCCDFVALSHSQPTFQRATINAGNRPGDKANDCMSLLLYPDSLVLLSLLVNHDIRLIKNKHCDLGWINDLGNKTITMISGQNPLRK